MHYLALRPLGRPLAATVRLPGSKSLSIRTLAAAALADGTSRLSGLLVAEDTRLMVEALRTLGFELAVDERAAEAVVRGTGGHVPAGDGDLYGGNSGATVRFCTALAALGQGTYRVDGAARMRQRPLGGLVEVLNALGAHVQYESQPGYPPVIIHAAGLNGGLVSFEAAPSSQMVSALLLAAPCARGDVLIEAPRDLPSKPYVSMTLDVMQAFGVEVVHNVPMGPSCAKHMALAAGGGTPVGGRLEAGGTPTPSDDRLRFVVPAPQPYRATEYRIEPDASAASYFLAAPAVAGGCVTVEGLERTSLQGDVAFADVLEQMGCRVEWRPGGVTVAGPTGQRLRGVDLDMSDMPDVVPTLAVTSCFAEGKTRIRNVAHLRIKESNRLATLATELGKLGAEIELYDDGLAIHPPPQVLPARIRTYNDHRIAMSFALAGLVVDGIELEDPGCVAKSFPGFFESWDALQQGHMP